MSDNNFVLVPKSNKGKEDTSNLVSNAHTSSDLPDDIIQPRTGGVKYFSPDHSKYDDSYYTEEELELHKKWKEHEKRGRFVALPFTGIVLEFLIVFFTSPALFMASSKIYMLECAIIPYITSAFTHQNLAKELMWKDMTTFWVEFIFLFLLNITIQSFSYIIRFINVLVGSAGLAFALVIVFMHFVENITVKNFTDIDFLHWFAMAVVFAVMLIKQIKKQDLTGQLG